MAYSKYKNIKVTVGGIKYDSVLESRRGQELILLEKAGKIQNLQRQVPYDLSVNGVKICKYIADFVYDMGGIRTVEDAKSEFVEKRDKAFPLKRKLMLACHGINVVLWPAREAKPASRLSKPSPE